MKKYYLFILLAMTTVFAASLSSCSETDNEKEEFPNWRKTNEAYYDKKYAEVKQLVAGGAADWKVLRSWSLNDRWLRIATTTCLPTCSTLARARAARSSPTR